MDYITGQNLMVQLQQEGGKCMALCVCVCVCVCIRTSIHMFCHSQGLCNPTERHSATTKHEGLHACKSVRVCM